MKEEQNLFEKAIKENKLEDFIAGNPPFFLPDRETGEQWYLGIWLYHIAPLLKEHKHEEYVIKIFQYLLETKKDDLSKIDLLLDHLFTYYYLLKEHRISINYISSLETDIKNKLIEYYLLMKDEKKDSEIQLFEQTIGFIKRNGALLDLNLDLTL